MAPTLEDLVDLLDRPRLYDNRYYSAVCAFHEDRKPSMLVYPDGFQCTACGERGSLQKLYTKLKKRDIPKVSALSITAPQHIPWTQIMADLPRFVSEAHLAVLRHPTLAVTYVQRGVAPSIVPLELGWWDGWLVIPLFDAQHQPYGLGLRAGPSFRDPPMRYTVPPGQYGSRAVFIPDWSLLDKYHAAFVPFGWFDAITLVQLGYPVAAWTLGKKPHATFYEALRMPLYVIPDHLETVEGMRFVAELGWRGTLIQLPYRGGIKDPNDFQARHQTHRLRRVLETYVKTVRSIGVEL